MGTGGRPGLQADPDKASPESWATSILAVLCLHPDAIQQVLCMPGGKPVIFHTIAAVCEERAAEASSDTDFVTASAVHRKATRWGRFAVSEHI